MSLSTGLKAFSSDGSQLNSNRNGDTVTFYLNLKKTSTGLLENETIYLLEEDTNGVLSEPIFDQFCDFSKDDEHFDIFSVDGDYITVGGDAYDFSVNVGAPTYDVNGYRIQPTLQRPILLRTIFKSDDEGFYDCRFYLKSSTTVVIIELYAEAEDQDERLINLLKRFGEEINHTEEIIFVESDINEDRSNNVLLNNKRKELLNIIGEVQPYFPTIRGLNSIINFFGYSKILTVKEYYLNPVSYKINIFDLNDTTSIKDGLVKLNNFGLFYDIDKVVEGEFDQYGDPITEEAMPMSYEEIAIKLFGLKDYIEKRDIGGVSKIIDIIGQKISFNRFKLRSWKNRVETFEVSKDIYPKLSVLYSTEYLVDLRSLENLVCEFAADDNIDPLQIYQLQNCYISHFANLYNDTPFFYDSPYLEVGAKVTLRNTSFDVPWDLADIPWLNYNEPQVTTWLNLGSVNFYKYSLKVYNSKGFVFEILSSDFTVDTFDVILPHIGFYDVEMKFYSLGGLVSRKNFENYIEIKPKNVEVISFFKIIEPELQFWFSNNLIFNNIYSHWDSTIYNNAQFSIDELEVAFETFNLVKYIDYNIKSGFAELNWKEYDLLSFNELMNLSWDDSVYEIPKLANAILTQFVAGGVFFINSTQINIPTNINNNNFYQLSTFLNQNFGDNYTYTTRIDHLNNQFIEILAKESGSGYDFYISTGNQNMLFEAEYDLNSWINFGVGGTEFGTWTELGFPWTASASIYRSNSNDEEFNTNNLRAYDNEISCPVYTPIFYTLDKSKIKGKKEGSHTIYREDGSILTTLQGLNFCYRFSEIGLYSIKSDVKDVNGNEYSIYKENIFNITEHGL